MDQHLEKLVNRLLSFVYRETKIEMVKKDVWTGNTLDSTLTPRDFTNERTLGYCLKISLVVKEEGLHHTISAEGDRLKRAIPAIKGWLNKQKEEYKIGSGVGVCASN